MEAKLFDYNELCDGKELCLIKLPSELIKYQRETNDLSFNLKDLKDGSRFKVQGIEYEALLIKSNVSFNCLCQNGDSLKAVDNFKNVIQVKRVLDIPKPEAPALISKKVEIPDSITAYLEKKEKKLKRLHKKQKKNKN